jgi:predicted anti-sigma-YlaC factor YlaD
MRRERLLQVFLAVLGVLFIALIYPLYTDLRHAKWLLEMHNETEPMFLSFFIALGPFLLIAAKKPSAHRLLIVFTAWWCLAHAAVMTIQTVQAWNLGVHRNFADVVIVGAIGLILLLLAPARRELGASTSP